MTISYLKGWLLHWRTMAWLNNIYLVIPLFLLFMVPESPVWLISKGRYDEAKTALLWLYKYQPIPPNQNKTFAELQFAKLIEEEQEKNLDVNVTGKSTIKEFLKPTGYKPLLLLCGVFLIQQFSGIYIFLFYSVTFFEAAGTTINPYIASIFIGLIRFVMCLVNSWMLKIMGRRLLLMTSAFFMGVCLLISGTFTHKINSGSSDTTWVPAVFLLLYVIASMLGLLAIPWTMTAEMFPLKIRSMAHSATTAIVNFIMFLAVQNYLALENFLGGSAEVQWFFAGVSFIGVIYFFIFLPETHKKKLSEIEDYFVNNTIYLGQKKHLLSSTAKAPSL